MYEWDEPKRLKTLAKHNADFAWMHEFDWTTAITRADRRRDYGEPRFVSLGLIRGKLYACAWTPRNGKQRLVMLRRANAREVKTYERQ